MSYSILYYLMTVIGKMSSVISTTGVISFIISIILGAGLLLTFDVFDADSIRFRNSIKSIFKNAMIVMVVTTTLNSLIPNKKEMLIIVGLHIGEKNASKIINEVGDYYKPLKEYIIKELNDATK